MRACNVCCCLVVVGNDIGAEGANALAASLEKNSTLTELRLNSKYCCSNVCRVAASVQDVCYGCGCCCIGVDSYYLLLVILCISVVCACNACCCCCMVVGNDIDAEGARALAASLEKNTTLKILDLSSKYRCSSACRVATTVQGVYYVCGCSCVDVDSDYVLLVACALVSLCIYVEFISSQGVPKCACNACCCMVVGNNLNAEGAKPLAASLEKNTTLTTLDIRGKHCCRSACRVASVCMIINIWIGRGALHSLSV